MALLESTDDAVTVHLSRREETLALHRSFTVPKANIVSVEHVDDLMSHVRGAKVAGAGLTGVVKLGTFGWTEGERDFCAVYRHHPGTIGTLHGYEYARILVSDEADEADKAAEAAEAHAP